MEPSKKRRLLIRLALILAALLTAYGSYGIYADHFKGLESRIVDRLFLWRSRINATPPVTINDTVHVDANLYFSRSQHGRVIENLARMNVSVQLVDILFENVIRQNDDQQLIDASRRAGNVIYGMRFDALINETIKPPSSDLKADETTDTVAWPVVVDGNPGSIYTGVSPAMPYPELSAAARGIGFLNIKADPDGIVRRLPLLVRYGEAYYPSVAFRAVCEYLNVPPQNIIVKSGNSLTLKDARRRENTAVGDIVIPIDEHGTMLLGATEYWDDIRHYSSSEIYQASEDPTRLDKLKAELSGKIVVLSPVRETGYQTRLVDRQTPLYPGAFHALLVQNILSGSFLHEVPMYANLLIQIGMLISVLLLSMRFSSPTLSLGTLVLTATYMSLAAAFFIYSGVIFQFVQPLLIMLCALACLLIGLGIEKAILFAQTERARKIAERELEIGRQIQAGFFPTSLPEPVGWELVSHFQAARHVAGDFYDVFTLGEDKKIGLVVADVCDKGVGAALFMALFRSSIRVLSGTAHSEEHLEITNPSTDPQKILLKVIQSINNYISITHEKAGMFATIFYAILDPASGKLTYINGGHEPPVVVGTDGIKTYLNPTGPAVGLLPDLEFKTRTIRLEPKDLLMVYTDGVPDARNKSGEAFSKEKLLDLLKDSPLSAKELMQIIKNRINQHILGENQFDDITILVLQRKG